MFLYVNINFMYCPSSVKLCLISRKPLSSSFSYQKARVQQLLLEQSTSHSIVCDDLQKVYPGRDGNPEKFAVRGLSLALPQGECFGMLGPNGAGKTSFINMVSTKQFLQ